MKKQALFSSKDNSKQLKCRLLQFLFGALRVKLNVGTTNSMDPIKGNLITACAV